MGVRGGKETESESRANLEAMCQVVFQAAFWVARLDANHERTLANVRSITGKPQ